MQPGSVPGYLMYMRGLTPFYTARVWMSTVTRLRRLRHQPQET